MGNRILSTDIAGLLKKHLGPLLLPVVLIKQVAGARDDTELTAGQAISPRRYPCRGITESYELRQIDGTTVQTGDKKILILGDTLPRGVIPEANDRVICERIEYVIQGVPERDPDAATYVCQGRG